MADAGWAHGTLVEPPVENEPDVPTAEVVNLLDEAEDIVNAVVPVARAEVERARREAERTGWLPRVRRRFRRPPGSAG